MVQGEIEVVAAEPPPVDTRKLSLACARDREMLASLLFLFLSVSVLAFPAAPASQFRCSDIGVAHRSLRGVSSVKETKNSNQKRACQGIDYGTPRSRLATRSHRYRITAERFQCDWTGDSQGR